MTAITMSPDFLISTHWSNGPMIITGCFKRDANRATITGQRRNQTFEIVQLVQNGYSAAAFFPWSGD